MNILIHGNDSYNSKKYLDSVISNFKQKHGQEGGSVFEFDPEKNSTEDLISLLTGSGLFSSKKLIVAKNLLAYSEFAVCLNDVITLGKISSGTSLILYESSTADKRLGLVKKILNEPFSREFISPSREQISLLIEKTVNEFGGKISKEAVFELCSIVGFDSWRAQNESKKLVHAVDGMISISDVKSNVHSQISENIWSFIDAISSRNRARAVSSLEREFIGGADPMYLLSMLIRQARLLIALSGSSVSDAEISKELNIKPFVVRKTRLQSKHFTQNMAIVFYKALARLDTALKRNRHDPRLLFTVLVDSILR